MKQLFAVLTLAISLLACGPEASDEAQSSTTVASVTCRPAYYCVAGTGPRYWYLGTPYPAPSVQLAACNAAIKAGTCTGDAAGGCYYASKAPNGCTPK